MAISPYASCPCGSGKQFKWCCQPYYSYVEKALHQHERGQHAAAEQTVGQLVEKHQQVPQAYGYQAQVLFLHDKSAEADAALQKAFDLDPNFAFGFWLRGLMRLDEGEAVGALILFRKTAEVLDPNARDIQAQVHARIGELELQFNRPVAARAALERAYHFAPQSQDLKQALDSVFGPESKLPEAARKAYTFRPAPPDKTEALRPAIEAATSGRLTDALKAFESLAESNSNNSAVAFNVALVRAWLGDNRRALEAIGRSIDPETDEAKAEEAGALGEVLRCGLGMEDETDYLEHRAYLEIRDPDAIGKLLTAWSEANRLVVVNVDREQGIFSALVLEKVPDLGTGIGTPVARLMSYLVLEGNLIRLWHSNRAMLEEVVQDLRATAGGGVSEPKYDMGPAQFGDVVAEIMLFPTREGVEPDQVEQKMRERAREYFEETWVRRPLKSLGGATPLDAASHPRARKRLPGVIRFMEQCLRGAGPTEEGKPSKPLYDFNRLRQKLGLAASASTDTGEVDFDTLSAAGLAAVKPEELSDAQVGDAFRAALRLDAPDLAGQFARSGASRASIPDRYPFFSHLANLAREDWKPEAVLRVLDEGEQADSATNEGRHREDYALARGKALAKSGDTDGAYHVFKEAISRSPASLNLYAPAAEAMLGRKQKDKALEFAELGLKQARAQQNRDAEQQFLELVAAAKK
jgi:thioredoxin-like negative regulator of GroEL